MTVTRPKLHTVPETPAAKIGSGTHRIAIPPLPHRENVAALAAAIDALVQGKPEEASLLLEEYRKRPSQIPPAPAAAPPLASPEYEAADEEVTAARRLLEDAIDRRSAVLGNLVVTRGHGPFSLGVSTVTIICRRNKTTDRDVYFLRSSRP